MDAATITLELVRVEDADDAGALRLGVQGYLLRSDEGMYTPATLRWDDALIQQLAQARARDPGAIQALGAGLRRFVAATGFAAIEPAIERAVAERRTIRIEVVSNAAELYALPWELLTLGDGRHVGELPGVEIVYRWPGARAAADSKPPAREGGRVLVAWSRAFGNVGELLVVDAIEAAMKAARLPFDRVRDVVEAASLPAIVAALEAGQAAGEPATLLYILCHGAPMGSMYGLGLDDGRGGRVVVDGGTLRRALGPFAGHVRAAVVMACDSGNAGALGSQLGSVAHELHRGGIAAVVAPRAPISGGAALELTGHVFAGMLSQTWSIEHAFQAARERLVRGGGEWAAFQLYSHAGAAGTRPFTIRPYRGLLAFEREHAALFFGREAELAEALHDLDALVSGGRPRLLVVAGASGTGKSSLVLAPLRVELERRGNFVAVIRPGKEPLAALTAARQARPADRPFVLIVDQFEEVFTHVVDRDRAAEASAFVRALWDMVSETGSTVSAIVTLRVDFVGRCGELAIDGAGGRLDRIVYDEAFRVFVAQMTPEGLRAAIERPAERVGLRVEPGLAERLIREVAEESNALPLLSYVLDELWRRRAGDMLTHAALAAAGGVTGALARHADAVVDALDEPAQAQARRTLVHLVMFGSDRSSGARRREEESHLRSRRDPQAWEQAVTALIDARLVVRRGEGQPTLEIAHEALIRHWDRLWTWYQADRDRLAMHNELERLVAQYTQYGALTGKALAFGQELLAGLDGDDAPAGAREAIAVSAARARRQSWIRRGLVAAALLVLAVFSIVSMTLYAKANTAAKNATGWAMQAQESATLSTQAALLSGAQRMMTSKPHVSAALLRLITVEGLFGWRQAGFEALQEPLPTIWQMERSAERLAFAADGSLVFGDGFGGVRVWAASGRRPRALAGTYPGARFALSDEYLFVAQHDTLTAWALGDEAIVKRAEMKRERAEFRGLAIGARTGALLAEANKHTEGISEQIVLRVVGDRIETVRAGPFCIVADPESEWFVCRVAADAVKVESWNGEFVGRVDEQGIGDAFAASGGLALYENGAPVVAWRWPSRGLPAGRRPISQEMGARRISAVAVFDAFTVVLSPGEDGSSTARLCTQRANTRSPPICEEIASDCRLLGRVGEQIALGCREDVQLRTAETLAVARHLRGLDAPVLPWESAFDPHGHVALSDMDGRLWRWRASDMPSRLTIIAAQGPWILAREPTEYGHLPHLQAQHGRVASLEWNIHEALQVEVRALRTDTLPTVPAPVSASVPLAADETWSGHAVTAEVIVAMIGREGEGNARPGRIVVLTPGEQRIEQRERTLPGGFRGSLVAATRDGAFGFARVADGLVRLDLRGDTVAIEKVLARDDLRTFLDVDPSGRVLVVERADFFGETGVDLIDTKIQQSLRRDASLSDLKLRAAAFSPDGKQMALGTAEGEILLAEFDPERPFVAAHRLRRHHAGVVSLAFSADGRMLAGADELGRLILWSSVPGGDGSHLTVDVPEAIWQVGISPDGRQLWALSRLGVLRYWTIPGDDAELRRTLGERATYCLSAAELQEFAGVVDDEVAGRCGSQP